LALRKIKWRGEEFPISYKIVNPDKSPSLLFLHGWGAKKELMELFAPHFPHFRQLYIDLPGFGGSQPLPIPLKTADYKEIVAQFLEEINFHPDGVIAHSFGGKVGLLLSPPVLILLASAGIPVEKPLSVKAKIALFKLLKKLGIGEKLRHLFVSADAKGASETLYQTFKNVVDEDFSSHFSQFKGEVLLFGGDRDTAVPPEAVRRQGELLGVTPNILPGDHFFFLNPENRVAIVKMVENLFGKRG